MKPRFFVALLLFLTVVIGCSRVAYAAELKGTKGSLNALNSGYAITRWPWDGGEILVGEDATVRACTTQPPYPEAVQVVFRWIRPNGSSWDTEPKNLTYSGDTWDGKDIYDAYDTQIIDMLSTPTEDWGVQAYFLDEEGKLQGPNPYPIVKIKAISWHAVPAVPFGTIATILAFSGALALYVARWKRKDLSTSETPK